MILFQVIENLLILYYGIIFAAELYLLLLFIIVWRHGKQDYLPKADSLPGISILVPAYNESVTIVSCIKSLLALDYPVYEIVLVNDGSTDNTLDVLVNAFGLKPYTNLNYSDALGTLNPVAIYRADNNARLLVVDKNNGGKADSLNVGLNLSQYNYCCSVDADSLLDSQALKLIVAPFLGEDGHKIAMVGGALAVANDSTFRNNSIDAGSIPKSTWVRFQAIEYLRSFWVNRVGLSRYNLLLILSGAFTLFRRDILLSVGGFYSPYNRHPYLAGIAKGNKGTVCEDMEIVVRIRRYLQEKGLPDRAIYLPWPICWTEVPERLSSLAKQRNRWHRGLFETIWIHRKIIFDPSYRVLGLIAMPYYLIFEALSPIIRVFTYIFLGFLIWAGRIHSLFTLLLLLFVVVAGALALGLATMAIESWAQKHSKIHLKALRYKSVKDWLKLLWTALLLDIFFGTIRNLWQLAGTIDFIRGAKKWGNPSRIGLKDKEIIASGEL
jgi:cellulose synthase/poly-beta-1,6-N-acetylglucosamine synthase-like glycosyltransferase